RCARRTRARKTKGYGCCSGALGGREGFIMESGVATVDRVAAAIAPPAGRSREVLGSIDRGRYAPYAPIGSGGMASVYIGRLDGPLGLRRAVAVKRMHPHVATDPELAAMFMDEARLASRIRHPNVVQTLDIVARDGELLIVLEYVDGVALD